MEQKAQLGDDSKISSFSILTVNTETPFDVIVDVQATATASQPDYIVEGYNGFKLDGWYI